MIKKTIIMGWVLLVLSLILTACGSKSSTAQEGTVKLTLGAYTTPREAYRELIPLFQKQWKEKTGQDVIFEESYLGSGAQSRAVVEGFEADIVALSLDADVTRIVNAGLITGDWKSGATQGIVSQSIVVFAVRPGNPKNIQDWSDLAQPGLEVLTPNPKTSGGAMWNVLALYGAAKRGMITGVPANDNPAAQAFLLTLLKNVTVMDKGARESITNFEKGVGDVAITYENEVLVGQLNGQNYEMVIPRSTILIQNPLALVDSYVDKHGVREVAEAFVNFLYTQQAQEIFAKYGLRSVNSVVLEKTAERYPPVEDLFSIEYFGGWDLATPNFFGENGIYNQVIVEIQQP